MRLSLRWPLFSISLSCFVLLVLVLVLVLVLNLIFLLIFLRIIRVPFFIEDEVAI